MLISCANPYGSYSGRNRAGLFSHHISDVLMYNFRGDEVFISSLLNALTDPETQEAAITDVKKYLGYSRKFSSCQSTLFEQLPALLAIVKKSPSFPNMTVDVREALDALVQVGAVKRFFDCFIELRDHQNILEGVVDLNTFKQAVKTYLSDPLKRDEFHASEIVCAVKGNPTFHIPFREAVAETFAVLDEPNFSDKFFATFRLLGYRKIGGWLEGCRQFLSDVTPDTVAKALQQLELQRDQNLNMRGNFLLPLFEAFEGLQGFDGVKAEHLNAEISHVIAYLKKLYEDSSYIVPNGLDHSYTPICLARKDLITLARISATRPDLKASVLSAGVVEDIAFQIAFRLKGEDPYTAPKLLDALGDDRSLHDAARKGMLHTGVVADGDFVIFPHRVLSEGKISAEPTWSLAVWRPGTRGAYSYDNSVARFLRRLSRERPADTFRRVASLLNYYPASYPELPSLSHALAEARGVQL